MVKRDRLDSCNTEGGGRIFHARLKIIPFLDFVQRERERKKGEVFLSIKNSRFRFIRESKGSWGEGGDRFKRCSFIPRSLDSLAN